MDERGKVDELLGRRDRLGISNLEWSSITYLVAEGKGVHYQTIRRMERRETLPRAATLRKLDDALVHVGTERMRKGSDG